MAPIRSTHIGGRKRSEINDAEPMYHQQHILAVVPLNSMPYTGPPMSYGNIASFPTEVDAGPVERAGPAMLFLPSNASQEEWDDIVASSKSGVGLTGSAAMGKVGPAIGSVDIAECEDSYLFRVSLPGVARDEREFSFDVEPEGKVLIKGVTTTGEEIVYKNSQVFEMRTQNLCPPGHFSISFQLPGPVDHQQLSGVFGTDGILEGIVKKKGD